MLGGGGGAGEPDSAFDEPEDNEEERELVEYEKALEEIKNDKLKLPEVWPKLNVEMVYTPAPKVAPIPPPPPQKQEKEKTEESTKEPASTITEPEESISPTTLATESDSSNRGQTTSVSVSFPEKVI